MGQLTPEDVDGMAMRVEVYMCSVCSLPVRFPRYNSVVKLIESRNGRCGQWANCFTGLSHVIRNIILSVNLLVF